MEYSHILHTFRNRLLTEYWGTKAAGILAYAQDTDKFLLAFRSAQVQSPNTFGVIGGAVQGVHGEKDVKPKQGATKEFAEETGYQGKFLSIAPLYFFQDKKENFEYSTFLGILPVEFTPKPSKKHAWETDHFSWVTLQQLRTLPNKHFGLEKMLADGAVLSVLKKLSKKSS